MKLSIFITGVLAVIGIAQRCVSNEAALPDRIGPAWEDARNPIVKIFEGKRLDLWSLRQVQRPPIPFIAKPQQARNPIDNFVIARLDQEKLAPTTEADRRTLIRRLCFDLTGLPPTHERVERFLADDRPFAYERLVDELLASPRYGEQMARLWLDLVRYSDSNGYDWDEFRPRAWLYRDYLIRSLNADKPYDRFLVEQLAGDELLAGPPRDAAEQEALIATTFLRLGPQDNSAPTFNEQSRMRHEWLVDLVETTSNSMLALTMSCCRCHDHKYDPLSQADHYRFRAFFEPLKYADNKPVDLAAEQEAINKQHAQIDSQKQRLEEKQRQIWNVAQARLRQPKLARLSEEDRSVVALLGKTKDESQQKLAEEIEKKLAVTDDELAKEYTDQEKQQRAAFDKQREALENQKRSFTVALLAAEEGDVAETKLLYQGDHKQPREMVAPGFVSAIDPNPAAISKPTNPETHGRRLALARWIANRDNPLTARVMVNRLWQHHFGQGLVATANDFGFGGAKPTHPELLDYLASEFVDQGWSIKAMQRQIVTSATYRQASAIPSGDERDSKNQFLARQSLRRLTAEQLRDAILATSGLQSDKSGGSPVWPELPSDVLQANPAFLDENAAKTKGWYPSPADQQDARSIFLVQKRTVRVPFMETFDLPENSTSCALRNVSTVAPQAFTLLNSPLAVRATEAFVERVKRQAGDEAKGQVDAAFQLALQRVPTDRESDICVKLLQQRGLVAVCRALLNVNEFVYLD